jgi:mercuric ion transport protein
VINDKKLLSIGIVEAGIAAVCCFTPLLVVLLGGVGFSSALGWLVYVLLPAPIFFIGLTGLALRKKRATS